MLAVFYRLAACGARDPHPQWGPWTFENALGSRRLSKDCERLPDTSKALLSLAGIRLLIARLARGED